MVCDYPSSEQACPQSHLGATYERPAVKTGGTLRGTQFDTTPTTRVEAAINRLGESVNRLLYVAEQHGESLVLDGQMLHELNERLKRVEGVIFRQPQVSDNTAAPNPVPQQAVAVEQVEDLNALLKREAPEYRKDARHFRGQILRAMPVTRSYEVLNNGESFTVKRGDMIVEVTGTDGNKFWTIFEKTFFDSQFVEVFPAYDEVCEALYKAAAPCISKGTPTDWQRVTEHFRGRKLKFAVYDADTEQVTITPLRK